VLLLQAYVAFTFVSNKGSSLNYDSILWSPAHDFNT